MTTRDKITEDLREIIENADLPYYENPFNDLPYPVIGEIKDHEQIKKTSIKEILKGLDNPQDKNFIDVLFDDDFTEEIDEIIRRSEEEGRALSDIEEVFEDNGTRREQTIQRGPPCAWYQPIHFYPNNWGIYIRKSCIKKEMVKLARITNLSKVRGPNKKIQLYLAAFLEFYFHEQFHHKVESFGFRLLASDLTRHRHGSIYKHYMIRIYQQYFGTSDCLEESLANAESILRMSKDGYEKKLDKNIRNSSKKLQIYFMKNYAIPGYKEGLNYLTENRFKNGLRYFQSQVVECNLKPSFTNKFWGYAPYMTRSMMNIDTEIYLIV
tara:strand:+ start:9 stop:980 length:972 start_codon:yes stop_codon:yes gene_type:complete